MEKKELLKKIRKKQHLVVPIVGNTLPVLIQTCQQAQSQGADILELRLDLWPSRLVISPRLSTVLNQIRRKCILPIIVTVRAIQEQGIIKPKFILTDLQRVSILRQAIPYVDVVDIEISSLKKFTSILNLIQREKKGLILSYHNFTGTPSLKDLTTRATRAYQYRPDIIKFATRTNNITDLVRLFTFNRHWMQTLCTVIPLGEFGTLGRIFNRYFGSCLTYAYLNYTTAPGQISLLQLISLTRLIPAVY